MNIIGKHLSEVSEAMTLLNRDEVDLVVNAIDVVRRNRGRLFVMGNGGSHATASHFMNDLMKMLKVQAYCMGDMTSLVSAYGNDNGWINMYVDPLREMLGEKPDGVIAISCSGESENVLLAMEYAASLGVITIGLTGPSEHSRINKVGATALVHVRADDIRVQEDLHLMVCHAVVREIHERMYR